MIETKDQRTEYHLSIITASSGLTVRLVVINLVRRPDRLARFRERIERDFDLFPAIDGLSSPIAQDSRHVADAKTAACWLSHATVLNEFATQTEDFCLVLEDDAVINGQEWFDAYLEPLVSMMSENNLDVLQVGFHEDSHAKSRGVKGFLGRSHREDPKLGFLLNQFSSGTHAYLVRRTSAAALGRLNNPVFVPADGFFRFLAAGQAYYQKHRVAMLTRSLVSQEDTSPANPSDVIPRPISEW
jgi:GR25 family glycosyltransferase involved in LPS biosynthesis